MMKQKENIPERTIQVSESTFLALVALRLKDRDLFPKKTKQAKRALQHIKISKSR